MTPFTYAYAYACLWVVAVGPLGRPRLVRREGPHRGLLCGHAHLFAATDPSPSSSASCCCCCCCDGCCYRHPLGSGLFATEKQRQLASRAANPPSAIAAASSPPHGSSASEQWRFYTETPGPWRADLAQFNGGRGLTALTDPQSAQLPGLMSFTGLEGIKQRAVHFVQAAIEHRNLRLAGSGLGRLNYIFIGNPGTGKVARTADVTAAFVSTAICPPPFPLADDHCACVGPSPWPARTAP